MELILVMTMLCTICQVIVKHFLLLNNYVRLTSKENHVIQFGNKRTSFCSKKKKFFERKPDEVVVRKSNKICIKDLYILKLLR